MKANQALVDLLGQIGERKKATVAQIALAWLLAPKAVDRPDSGHHVSVSGMGPSSDMLAVGPGVAGCRPQDKERGQR
jgi:hypothetical protein